MTKRFGFHSNSRGTDEIKDLPFSIDFQAWKHRFVTLVLYLHVSPNMCLKHYRVSCFTVLRFAATS